VIDFRPAAFFDIDGFSHADLLDSAEPVWAALGKRLSGYLEAWTDWSINIDLPAGVHLLGDRIAIAPGCSIEPGAVIVGPATTFGRMCCLPPAAWLAPTAKSRDRYCCRAPRRHTRHMSAIPSSAVMSISVPARSARMSKTLVGKSAFRPAVRPITLVCANLERSSVTDARQAATPCSTLGC